MKMTIKTLKNKILLIYGLVCFGWVLLFELLLPSLVPETLLPILPYHYVILLLAIAFSMAQARHKPLQLLEHGEDEEEFSRMTSALFALSSRFLAGKGISDEEFLKEVFWLVFEMTKESDCGSVYVVDGEVIRFIEGVGYDLDNLNEMKMPTDSFEMDTTFVRFLTHAEERLANRLEEDYASYHQHNPKIAYSLYMGFSDEKSFHGGFSLDISKDNPAMYSAETIHKLQDLQIILNGLYRIKKQSEQKITLQEGVVKSFIRALEFHDSYTKGHSEAVAYYAQALGEALELSEQGIEELYWAAIVHDIGKIIIPSSILNKEMPLSQEEFDLIRRHPEVGYDILTHAFDTKEIPHLVKYHHEWFDGTGYPGEVKGEEIPLLARIISIADAYHAMTSDRPYKKALGHEQALEELRRGSGSQFDQDLVHLFISLDLKPF